LKPATNAAPQSKAWEGIVSWYPGWDSLDSVRNWHTVFEVSGIAFLALLVGAEILAFQYGHRKDELTAIAETAADAKRRADTDAAESRRLADVKALQDKLAAAEKVAVDASKKAGDVERQAAPRHLTESQRQTIIAAIQPLAPKTVDVVVPAGDSEAKSFAAEFVDLFRNAGWDAGTNDGINQAFYTGNIDYGIQVTLNQADASAGRLPPGAEALIRVLLSLGLTKGGFANPQIPSGKIEFRVGTKPPA
jgi:hypothetical protein